MADRTDRLAVLVCRDCCCGNPGKHPDEDHDGQLDAIRSAMAGVPDAVVAITKCLDVCDRSNVVVVRHQRRRTRSDIWLGGVLDTRQTDALCAWLRGGGPRSKPLPTVLRVAAFRPPHPVHGRGGRS